MGSSRRHCNAVPDPAAEDNVIRVVLADGVDVDLESLRRNLYASSSYGICGKATIGNALAAAPPLDDPARFAPDYVYALPDKLEAAQTVFKVTGGLHSSRPVFAGSRARGRARGRGPAQRRR